jgi:hypothetical protein
MRRVAILWRMNEGRLQISRGAADSLGMAQRRMSATERANMKRREDLAREAAAWSGRHVRAWPHPPRPDLPSSPSPDPGASLIGAILILAPIVAVLAFLIWPSQSRRAYRLIGKPRWGYARRWPGAQGGAKGLRLEPRTVRQLPRATR